MDKARGYVWGPINAEDLAAVPESNWVITSGMTGVTATQGRLYAIDWRVPLVQRDLSVRGVLRTG